MFRADKTKMGVVDGPGGLEHGDGVEVVLPKRLQITRTAVSDRHAISAHSGFDRGRLRQTTYKRRGAMVLSPKDGA
jgi:hypothetical protein